MRYADGTSERILQDTTKGRPTSPFTPAEHRAKLDELTDAVLGKARADRLFALVDQAPNDTPAAQVTAPLAGR